MKQLIILLIIIATFGGILYWSQVRKWDDKSIDSLGEYQMSNGYSLSVTSIHNFVHFKLSKNGKKLLFSQDKASIFQRFALLWESKAERLWFDSSDIGISVYIRNNNGQYVPHYIVPEIFADQDYPQILSEDVPPHIRSKLRSFNR